MSPATAVDVSFDDPTAATIPEAYGSMTESELRALVEARCSRIRRKGAVPVSERDFALAVLEYQFAPTPDRLNDLCERFFYAVARVWVRHMTRYDDANDRAAAFCARDCVGREDAVQVCVMKCARPRTIARCDVRRNVFGFFSSVCTRRFIDAIRQEGTRWGRQRHVLDVLNDALRLPGFEVAADLHDRMDHAELN